MIRIPYHLRRPEGVRNGIPKLRALRYKFDCLFENIYISLSLLPKIGINESENREERIVLSLTSYPGRIGRAYFAIKSLMIQTYKADKIILWLAEEQFPEKELPKKFWKLIKRGLTIRWCNDLRSHKKYYYALQEQKENELVITYDDDIIYEYDSIEKLVFCHEKFPQSIICNRGHEVTCDSEGNMKPYKDWKIHSYVGVNKPSMYVMPSTGYGCLYPYGCMPEVTFDWDLAKENALTADDVWMRFCSFNNGVSVVKTRGTIAIPCSIYGKNDGDLTIKNDICGENQKTIDRLTEIFN